MPNSDAPSMRAASSMSSDTDSMYWRMKKMPKAFAALGMISGQGVSIQPNVLRIMTNRGTRSTAKGIVMEASKTANITLRPGNWNFAKA